MGSGGRRPRTSACAPRGSGPASGCSSRCGSGSSSSARSGRPVLARPAAGSARGARRRRAAAQRARRRGAHHRRRAARRGAVLPRLLLRRAAQLARAVAGGAAHRPGLRGHPRRLVAGRLPRPADDLRRRPVPALRVDGLAVSGDRAARAEQLDRARREPRLGLADPGDDGRLDARRAAVRVAAGARARRPAPPRGERARARHADRAIARRAWHSAAPMRRAAVTSVCCWRRRALPPPRRLSRRPRPPPAAPAARRRRARADADDAEVERVGGAARHCPDRLARARPRRRPAPSSRARPSPCASTSPAGSALRRVALQPQARRNRRLPARLQAAAARAR